MALRYSLWHTESSSFELCYICCPFFIWSGCITITFQDVFCCSFQCGVPVFLWLLADRRMNANGLHAPICPVLTVAHPIEPVNPRCHIRLKENVIHHMKNFLPVQINCNMAEVHLTEVLYNGCWMYTAATIQLVNLEDTLFMPGSADIKVCGSPAERRRKDMEHCCFSNFMRYLDILCIMIYLRCIRQSNFNTKNGLVLNKLTISFSFVNNTVNVFRAKAMTGGILL